MNIDERINSNAEKQEIIASLKEQQSQSSSYERSKSPQMKTVIINGRWTRVPLMRSNNEAEWITLKSGDSWRRQLVS